MPQLSVLETLPTSRNLTSDPIKGVLKGGDSSITKTAHNIPPQQTDVWEISRLVACTSSVLSLQAAFLKLPEIW